MGDIARLAIPFGIVGGRLYHVVTDPELYLTAGRDPWAALYIWRGGPRPSHRPMGATGSTRSCSAGQPRLHGAAHRRRSPALGYKQYATFQPTFLYESLWDLALIVLLLAVDRRFKLTPGRLFALYVMGYTLGRGWIEYLRIDTANHFWGLRLNDWTSLLLFLAAACYFTLLRPRTRASDEPLAAEPAPTGADIDGDLDDGHSVGTEARLHAQDPRAESSQSKDKSPPKTDDSDPTRSSSGKWESRNRYDDRAWIAGIGLLARVYFFTSTVIRPSAPTRFASIIQQPARSNLKNTPHSSPGRSKLLEECSATSDGSSREPLGSRARIDRSPDPVSRMTILYSSPTWGTPPIAQSSPLLVAPWSAPSGATRGETAH